MEMRQVCLIAKIMSSVVKMRGFDGVLLVLPSQCQVEENVSEGVGPNKKLAKRNAAESMLQLLGFSRPSPQPSKPAIKNTQSSEVSHPQLSLPVQSV